MKTRLVPPLIAAAAAACLAACGGSSGAGIGGVLSGLNAGQSVTLLDNNSDALTLDVNGSFRFATDLDSGAAYSVSILTQPAGQVCEVANGIGTVDSNADSVTSVSIACVTTSSLGGSVSGLTTGTTVTLSDSTVLLPVASNGAFAFPGVLVQGRTTRSRWQRSRSA